MVQCIDFSPVTEEASIDSMLEIKVASHSVEQKAIEAELMYVHCGTTSGHFMHRKKTTAKMKDVRWSTHNSRTSVNVCMHEKCICTEVDAYMNVCMRVVFHCIYSICMCSLYSNYCISSIRRLGVNQQLVCCVPGVKRSTGVNLKVEFCRHLERITTAPPGAKMSRGV